jgi:hypothetical protein
MIGAGMISVLVFPLLGGRIAGPIGGLESVSAEADEAVAEY